MFSTSNKQTRKLASNKERQEVKDAATWLTGEVLGVETGARSLVDILPVVRIKSD